MRRIAIWIFLFAFTVFTISACSKNVNPLAPSAKSPANKTKTLDEASDSLIDNFENDQSYASGPGQRDAMWWVSNASCYWLWPVSNTYGNSSTCLRVHYAKSAGQEWSFISAGGLMDAGKFHNFTSASSISMQVCGQVALMVKFEDADGHQSGDTETLTANTPSSWSALNWNLTGMNWGSCDRSRITNIFIFVQPGQVAEGEFFLDDLQAAPAMAPTPTPIPGPVTSVNWAMKVQCTEYYDTTTTETKTFTTPILQLHDGALISNVDVGRGDGYSWLELGWETADVSYSSYGINFSSAPTLKLVPHYTTPVSWVGYLPVNNPPSSPTVIANEASGFTVQFSMLRNEEHYFYDQNNQRHDSYWLQHWSYDASFDVTATGPLVISHSDPVVAGASGTVQIASGTSQTVPFTITLAPQHNGTLGGPHDIEPQSGKSTYFEGSDDYDNNPAFRSSLVSYSQNGNVITGTLKLESITP